ncbi:hypothetical protein Dform_01108 [Dehalogenimonas formicexedens]|uniref:Uncharacterized protein n=1 Tax=Dehalogenimonas formicexedens TaxID=1839801 RepID=A0A1P8F7T1_9CHLR|nr:hypothetical protein [Dehalogenimonas formicexedens]APV44442.1 hypothetical protein Dform_01108 [Dehalogenimonas formicexedens]
MDIGWWRDLVIVIGGVVAILIGLVVLVLVFSIYRKTNEVYERSKHVMDSIQKAACNVESFTEVASKELIKPVIEIAAIFHGLKAGLGGFFRRKE